jgi:hypothetical protein
VLITAVESGQIIVARIMFFECDLTSIVAAIFRNILVRVKCSDPGLYSYSQKKGGTRMLACTVL